MKRKAFAVGFLATVLAAVAVVPSCYSRFATSKQRFQQYFQDLGPKGSSLNPVERFVFSLVLANSESAPARK
jgi:hypothetical protein